MDILNKISLNVTDEAMRRIEKRDIVYVDLNEVIETFIENFEIEGKGLDKNTVFVTEKGVLIEVDSTFTLYLYKEYINKYSNLPLYAFSWVRKGDFERLSIGEITEICNILDIPYPTKLIEETPQVKNTAEKKDKYAINFEVTCWECGNLLDDDGNCNACACSKEIL